MPAAITPEGADPDGNSLTFRIISEPDHGSLSGTAPDLTYTPENDFSGADAFSFVASDGHLDSNPAEVTIEIAATNDAPTAEDDIFTAGTTPVTTGDVLANDSDPDGDTLAVSDFTRPARGTAADNEDGTFTYTPGSGFTGKDSFTYTASDSAGATDTAEVTIRVRPEVSITAQPQSIEYGSSAELSWTAEYADTVTIDPGIEQAGPSGTAEVSPETDTTYTITATGPGGISTDSVSMAVTRPPQMTLSISPSVINHGESATLTWSASPADRVYINQDIGEVSASGSITVTPDYTTTYELTAVNSDLTTHHGVSVKVLGNPPDPQPEGTFGNQYNDLVPEDASLAAYDPERFVVITGKVADESGNPIQAVDVEIIDHPEYGSVTTDASGRFSIPAEGGSLIVLSYEKEDYLTAHRKVEAGVMDVIPVAPVTLVARDPESTFVDFNGDPDTVITHQSSETTDEFGTRSATMVFTRDTRAYELDKYGNRVRELNSITARATEYETPQSMPAKLPPNSAYTYCTELEADEARRVEFEDPVITYVDNFLGFQVGEAVPVGYYDRDRAEWVPAENGLVIRLLDTSGNGRVDALDADGDGEADDLDDDGSTGNEITGLSGSTYQPGDTYWRFCVKHLTPWDCNWPFAPPMNAREPDPKGVPTVDEKKEENLDCKTSTGSHAQDRSRVLHQEIPIPGTDLSLHYASDRVKGYKTGIDVPVSGDSIPSNLKEIIVQCRIAGKTMRKNLSPLPNQKAEFVWDGRDYEGDQVIIPVSADIRIGFVYDLIYYSASNRFRRAWAQPGSYSLNIQARDDITYWKKYTIQVTPPKSSRSNTLFSGWSLSPHHHLSRNRHAVLHKGNGEKVKNTIDTATTAGMILPTVAGTGDWGYTGDGGPATEAKIDTPADVILDHQGGYYIADTYNHCIRKVNSNGTISTVAGTGNEGYSGDGGPAVKAELNDPTGIALDQEGNLYIADSGSRRIRKVDFSGIITTVAGKGTRGYSGDGGPATEAEFGTPSGLAFQPFEGCTYFFLCASIFAVDTCGTFFRLLRFGCGFLGHLECFL